MMVQPSARGVASSVVQDFAVGLAVDRASYEAGYASASSECPAGRDMFSFYLGRFEARRYKASEARAA